MFKEASKNCPLYMAYLLGPTVGGHTVIGEVIILLPSYSVSSQFALTVIHGSGRVLKNGKALREFSM